MAIKIKTRRLIGAFKASPWKKTGMGRRDIASVFRGARKYHGSKLSRLMHRKPGVGVVGGMFGKPRKIIKPK